MINIDSMLNEVAKLANITDTEALDTLKKLRKLDREKPTAGELGRGAAVGAAAMPVISATSKLIAGGSTTPGGVGRKLIGGARQLAASSVSGAAFGGGLPYLRHRAEYESKKQKLREYLDGSKRVGLRNHIKRNLGV